MKLEVEDKVQEIRLDGFMMSPRDRSAISFKTGGDSYSVLEKNDFTERPHQATNDKS